MALLVKPTDHRKPFQPVINASRLVVTKPGAVVLVFDFGGGTLDVTIMRREPSSRGRQSLRAIDSYGVQLGGLAAGGGAGPAVAGVLVAAL